jgi:GT2 family glycosyltransferase
MIKAIPDLSVIIVNHNGGELLLQTIASLFQSTNYLSFEIIVVDNASNDNSVSFVRKNFPQVKVLTNVINKGFAAANNQGIKNSRGRYILFLNPDIVLFPNSLKSLIDFMDQNPVVGIGGAKLLYPDRKLQFSCRKYSTPLNLIIRGFHLDSIFNIKKIKSDFLMDWDHNSCREVDYVTGACMIVRREAIKEVGLFDKKFKLYFEDQDWCLRMHKKKWKVFYVPKSVMIHYHKRDSAKGILNKKTIIHIKSMIYFFKKHGFGHISNKIFG